MAVFTAGSNVATGDTLTATRENQYTGAGGSVDYLNSTPGPLTYADFTTAAAPAAPGAAKGRFYVVTGDRPGFRSGAAGAAEVLATRDATETLTNKTLTSPVVNTPTGIVKGDVGLGNVDNTSDATKDSAVATLTNKTLTSPVINTGATGTGIGASAGLVAAGNHTTPAMTATVAGHVPTPPNNTTTFLRGDGTFAAPTAGALTRAGGNLTEATTTSATEVDLLTISSLSILATTPFRLFGQGRKSSGAAAAGALGLKMNTTIVVAASGGNSDLLLFSTNNQAEDGMFVADIGVRQTDYQRGGVGMHARSGAVGYVHNHVFLANNNPLPIVTITALVIRAVSDGINTVGADEANAYTYAVS